MSYFSTHASIRPKSIVVYSKWNGDRRLQYNLLKPPKKNDYSHSHLTYQSQKRMKKALELLIYTAKYKTVFVKATNSHFRYKLNFVTLTLPSRQMHTDREIVKNCLSPFLENWQNGRKGFLYIWKAEVQHNGNIHFHLVTNSFIHYLKLRKRWNKAINKLGYVDRSNSDNPNSTDVHAVEGKKDLASYLAKYMNKKDIYSKVLQRYHRLFDKYHKACENQAVKLPKNYFRHIKRGVTCRLWSASKALLSQPPSSCRENDSNAISWKMLEKLQPYAIESDYCYSYFLEDYDLDKFPEFHQLFKEHFAKLLDTQERNVINESINAL